MKPKRFINKLILYSVLCFLVRIFMPGVFSETFGALLIAWFFFAGGAYCEAKYGNK